MPGPLRAAALCAALLVAVPSVEQRGASREPQFDRDVVSAVDRLFPGFLEVLETDDPGLLNDLAVTLAASREAAALPVLAWMVRYSPGDFTRPIRTLVETAAAIPVDPLLAMLAEGTSAQRLEALGLIRAAAPRLREADQTRVIEAVVVALRDHSSAVRESAVDTLPELRLPEAVGSLGILFTRRDEVEAGWWRVWYDAPTAPQPLSRQRPSPPTFAPEVVKLVSAIQPDFVRVLTTGSEQSQRELITALAPGRSPESVPVLVWILSHGQHATLDAWVAGLLVGLQHRTGRVPLPDLAALLTTGDASRRLAVAEFFNQVFSPGHPRTTAPARSEVVSSLIAGLADANLDVRRRLVTALGRTRSREATLPLIELLKRDDLSPSDVPALLDALAAIGDPRALPAFEQWARPGPDRQLRERAARHFVDLKKPADAGAEIRRLLWEQPDTALELDVLAGGTRRLPEVWNALANGSKEERRAAAALVAWYPDRRSVPHVLDALANAPGEVTRRQLLFALNMILLNDGHEVADVRDRELLAARHLAQLREDLATNSQIHSDIRAALLNQVTLAIYPGSLPPTFRASVPGGGVGEGSNARVSSSEDEFLAWVGKKGSGVAFHPFKEAGGAARVATSVYMPNGRVVNQAWITLYRRTPDGWSALPFVPHDWRHPSLSDPNLRPAILKNYGAQDPLKRLRLDIAMERIRVRWNDRHFGSENSDVPGRATRVDDTYVPLFERYRTSDSANVRTAAEFQLAYVTGHPNVRFLIDTINSGPIREIRRDAVEILARYMDKQFAAHGRPAEGPDREALIVAALVPRPIGEPGRLDAPQRSDIAAIKTWGQYGLVELRFGEGRRAQSGYSLLFTRDEGRWVFACRLLGWIS
jgi:HEAT repeat protein